MFQPNRGCWRTYLSLVPLPRHLKCGERGTAILLSDTMKCSLSTSQTGCSSLQGRDLSNTPKKFLHKSSEEHSYKTAKPDWKLEFKTELPKFKSQRSSKAQPENRNNELVKSFQSKRSQTIWESWAEKSKSLNIISLCQHIVLLTCVRFLSFL